MNFTVVSAINPIVGNVKDTLIWRIAEHIRISSSVKNKVKPKGSAVNDRFLFY